MKNIVLFLIVFIITIHNLQGANLNDEKYEMYRERLVAGAMVNTINYYMGSKDYTTMVIPYIDFESKNWTIRSDKGVLYRAVEDKNYVITFGAFYYVPRTSSMDAPEVFEGIDDAKFDVPLVSHNSYYIGKGFEFIFRLEQSVLITSSQNYKTFITYNKKLNNKLFYEGSVGSTFASAGYINNWFGISNEELANNNYFNHTYEFNKSVGLFNVFTSHYLYYDFSYDCSLLFGVNIARLTGDVNNSPIVEKGSPIVGSYMVSFNYKFR